MIATQHQLKYTKFIYWWFIYGWVGKKGLVKLVLCNLMNLPQYYFVRKYNNFETTCNDFKGLE